MRRTGFFPHVLLVALFCACAGPETATQKGPATPSIVLVSIDTLRSDRLPSYGYTAGSTPRLDAFASQATVFERAYTSCPLTLPAHATLLTGLDPPDHGVRDNRGFVLDETPETLARRLQSRGYATSGFVSSMVLRRSTGISRGFDTWDDGMDGDTSRTFAQRRGDETVALAIDWIDRRKDGPFFLFVHLYDPHTPYAAPDPWSGRFVDPYDAEIAWTDTLIGRLLDALSEHRLYDEAMILVVSDHGEGLGDHVEAEHGLLLYRETLQVPLIVKVPGQSRGKVRRDTVGLIDVMPTVLDAIGEAVPDLPGRSLLLAPPKTARGLYAETFFPKHQYGFSPLRSAIRGTLHFIEAPRPELFDLEQDPGERSNLMRTRSAPPSLLAVLNAAGSGRETRAEISAEEQEKLASLGYVGGAEFDAAGGPLADPKDRVHEVEELFRLVDAVGKRPDPAVELRLVELIENLGVRNESLSRIVANNLLLAGRAGAASRVLAPFTGSNQIETRILLGQTATTSGAYDEAERYFRAALALDAENAGARLGLGILFLSAGRTGQARPWLEQALARDPSLAEGWNALAVIHASGEDWTPAIEAWSKAVAIDPALADAWYNLALAYDKTGRADLAAEARRRFERVTAAP